jgi:hypothetical protein
MWKVTIGMCTNYGGQIEQINNDQFGTQVCCPQRSVLLVEVSAKGGLPYVSRLDTQIQNNFTADAPSLDQFLC